MIAVDTNIVLRYLLQDDEERSPKASKLFEGDEKILITDVVLVETLWILKGQRYGLSKDTLTDVVQALIEDTNIVFEDSHAVWCALDDYINGSGSEFSDALIVNKSQRFGNKTKLTAYPLYTFDECALRIDGTKKP